jgi:hypothetical protein
VSEVVEPPAGTDPVVPVDEADRLEVPQDGVDALGVWLQRSAHGVSDADHANRLASALQRLLVHGHREPNPVR